MLKFCPKAEGCCPIGYTAIELEKRAYEIQWSDNLSKTTGCTTKHAKRTVLSGSDDHAHAGALPDEDISFEYSFANKSGTYVQLV